MSGLLTQILLIASHQHGVVSRAQLAQLGASANTVKTLRRRGHLFVLHRGVYVVGRPLEGWHGLEMAAVLACGHDRAFVSHLSAARMWGILEYPEAASKAPLVEVSVLAGNPQHAGITTHRIRQLMPIDRQVLDGIPVTSPTRTLLDVAAIDPEEKLLPRATNQARAKRLIQPIDLRAVIERYPTSNGISNLRKQLGNRGYTRSVAERKLLTIIRERQLPEPETNVRIHGFEVDFLWRDRKVVVEVDGFTFHSTSTAFEKDRLRDGILKDHNYKVIRVTWHLVTKQPDLVAKWIRNALAPGVLQG